MSVSSRELFRKLLHNEILKLNLCDLDFGIYRILKYRRKRIEQFINHELDQILRQTFQTGLAEQITRVEQRIKSLTEQLEQSAPVLGFSAPYDDDGNLRALLQQTPTGIERQNLIQEREYLKTEQELTISEENRLYNTLYIFLLRYYRDGDFIPQMRRGPGGTYHIAYSGEDTYMHWRSKGSHYIKTTEELRQYTCIIKSWSVQFLLYSVDEEKDNRKGKNRYFVPLSEQITHNDEKRLLTIPFAFRPLTTDEEETFANGNSKNKASTNGSEDTEDTQHRLQDRLLEYRLTEIIPHLPGDIPPDDLFTHLRRYTRKNRTDYFVHTDLGTFLKAEFDYYLKNEFVLAEAISEPETLRPLINKFQALRTVGYRLIDLLDEIESFQAQLFEKRKFVLQTNYLIAIRVLPEILWDTILQNTAQQDAWRTLFGLEGEITKETLRTHPTLVVDTRHFDDTFRLTLLSHLEDRDGICDGTLVQSENYAALRTLQPIYQGKVKVIYIDPPYNTGSDGFLYKDDFARHSTWLSMMEERLRLGRDMLAEDGMIFVSIDYNEEPYLRLLLDDIFGNENYRNTFVVARVKKTIQEREQVKRLNWGHNILFFYANSESTLIVPPTKKQLKKERWHSFDAPGIRSKMQYELFGHTPPENRYWMYEESRALAMIEAGELRQNAKTGKPEYKLSASEQTTLDTNWMDIIESDSEWFDNGGKNTSFIQRILSMSIDKQSHILDYFAGSGSTAQAVIQQNRKDGVCRKFTLIEINGYFDTILVPRIQKIMYAPEWKDGKPKTSPTFVTETSLPNWVKRSPRLIKIIHLESYEDSMNALQPPPEDDHVSQLSLFEEQNLLRYLMPIQGNDTNVLLNLEQLEHPFDYRLSIVTPEGIQETPVDIVETTNILLGLHMQRLRELDDKGRSYIIVEALYQEQHILIIWRDVTDLDPARERAFLQDHIDLSKYATIYTNADSAIPRAMSLDQLLKDRMLEMDRTTRVADDKEGKTQ